MMSPESALVLVWIVSTVGVVVILATVYNWGYTEGKIAGIKEGQEIAGHRSLGKLGDK